MIPQSSFLPLYNCVSHLNIVPHKSHYISITPQSCYRYRFHQLSGTFLRNMFHLIMYERQVGTLYNITPTRVCVMVPPTGLPRAHPSAEEAPQSPPRIPRVTQRGVARHARAWHGRARNNTTGVSQGFPSCGTRSSTGPRGLDIGEASMSTTQ